MLARVSFSPSVNATLRIFKHVLAELRAAGTMRRARGRMLRTLLIDTAKTRGL